ncbi:MAG TPA: hypothetical protein VF828_03990 [Patescibacteria group bacterium]
MKLKRYKINKSSLVFAGLFLLLAANIFFISKSSDELTQAKRQYFSWSLGDHYYGQLRLWDYYARKGDWDKAISLEPGLDPADINSYKIAHYPPELKKSYNQLVVKSSRNPDDLVELAKILISLNRTADAFKTVKTAHDIDPVRSDIEKLYYSLSQLQ